MIVVVTLTNVKVEVECEALTIESARRAVENNWQTVYRHRARWHNGWSPANAPDVRVVDVQEKKL